MNKNNGDLSASGVFSVLFYLMALARMILESMLLFVCTVMWAVSIFNFFYYGMMIDAAYFRWFVGIGMVTIFLKIDRALLTKRIKVMRENLTKNDYTKQ